MNERIDSMSKIFEHMNKRFCSIRMIEIRISPAFRLFEYSNNRTICSNQYLRLKIGSLFDNRTKSFDFRIKLKFYFRIGCLSIFKYEQVLENLEISNNRLFE